MAAARGAVAAALLVAVLAGGAEARATTPTPTSAPAVTGTLAVGDRLEAGPGTWTSATALRFSYQWHRCDAAGGHCSSVHGATAAGYTLTRADAGKAIGLTVTAAEGASQAVAYASLVGPVAPPKPLLVSTAQPQITGLAVGGSLLQVTTGGWSPPPKAVTYAWERCNANGRLCADIAGASQSSYAVSNLDVGHALVARVEAGFGQTTQAALSTATAPAVGGDVTGPTHSTPPLVTGTAQRGAQLSGSTGEWVGIGSLAYAYQWYRCDDLGGHCASIHGATKPTYTTVAADVGRTIGFTVRATDATGSAAAYASLFGPVAPAGTALAASTQPQVAGSARPGGVLTVSAGAWFPASAGTGYSYAWLRCNAHGRVCVRINGAARRRYAPTAADVGHALVAVVTALAGATSQPAFSTASPAVV
jgi:hypothetical protein